VRPLPILARRAPVPVLVQALALAGVLLAGCAEPDPASSFAAVAAVPPPAGAARLVVYRPAPDHLLGVLADRDVAIDGKLVCTLADDRFFARAVPAGAQTIAVGNSELTVTALPGKDAFVRVGFNPKRGSLLGWIPPVLGFTPDARTPDSGLFALDQIDPPSAARELAGMTVASECR
jgi:hypothetical protein